MKIDTHHVRMLLDMAIGSYERKELNKRKPKENVEQDLMEDLAGSTTEIDTDALSLSSLDCDLSPGPKTAKRHVDVFGPKPASQRKKKHNMTNRLNTRPGSVAFAQKFGATVTAEIAPPYQSFLEELPRSSKRTRKPPDRLESDYDSHPPQHSSRPRKLTADEKHPRSHASSVEQKRQNGRPAELCPQSHATSVEQERHNGRPPKRRAEQQPPSLASGVEQKRHNRRKNKKTELECFYPPTPCWAMGTKVRKVGLFTVCWCLIS
jgi:hypothetical protein